MPTVLAGQRHAVSLTDAYVAMMAAGQSGKPVRPLGLPSPYRRKDTTPQDVYARPAAQARYDISQGIDVEAAIEGGLTRALSLAMTDMQLAKTYAAQDAMSGYDGITGYERVPGGGKTCALCLVASTQRYHTGDLMPIHPGCACDVEPLFGENPRVIHPELLQDVQDTLAERFPDDSIIMQRDITPGSAGNGRLAQNVLITHQHGELGPVLGIRGQHFTGPNDI